MNWNEKAKTLFNNAYFILWDLLMLKHWLMPSYEKNLDKPFASGEGRMKWIKCERKKRTEDFIRSDLMNIIAGSEITIKLNAL